MDSPGDYTPGTRRKQRQDERGTQSDAESRRGLFQSRRRNERQAARFAMESADFDFF